MPRTTPPLPRPERREDALPALFTAAADTVDFDAVVAGTFRAGSERNGRQGADTVLLPTDAAAAAASGFAPGTNFLGGPGADGIDGRGLADRVAGAGGNDRLRGGNANDTLFGGAGADRLDGDADNDRLAGGGGSDSLDGGNGDDTLEGGAGQDRLAGGAGRDSLVGGGQRDTLRGGAGEDTLDGGAGRDALLGGSGGDLLRGGEGADTLSGGGGNDTILGGDGGDRVDAGAGDDLVLGGDGDDVLAGNRGDDTLDGGNGADTLRGGADNGRASFATARLGNGPDADDWFDAGILDRIGQTSVLGSFDLTTTDQAAWARFAAPRGYSGIDSGIGVWSGGGDPNNHASHRNPEINAGDGETTTGDVLTFVFKEDAIGAELGLALFYAFDVFPEAGRVETASVVLRDAGQVIAAFTVDAAGRVAFTMGEGVVAVALDGVGNAARRGNPGISTLSITDGAAAGTARFDEIALSAAPIRNGDQASVSDFLVTSLSVSTDRIETIRGGDLLILGDDGLADVVRYAPTNGGIDTIRQFESGIDRVMLRGVDADDLRFATLGGDTLVTFIGFDAETALLRFEGVAPTLADFAFV